TVNATSFNTGTYAGALTFTAPGAANSPRPVPVTVRVIEGGNLSPGVPVPGLGAGYGGDLYFAINVPALTPSLVVSIAGGTGDADLSVRYGRPPTATAWDCRPYSGGNNESCSLLFPQAGTYYVMLHAFNTFSGVTLTASLGGPPAGGVSHLVGTPASVSRINLSWLDGSPNETGFSLNRREKKFDGTWSAWQDAGTRPANATTHADSVGVSAGTSYLYRIRACNAAGCSAWAASPTITTPAPTAIPPAPASLAATVTSATRVSLAWPDAGSLENRYQLFRRSRPTGGTFGAYVSIAVLPANTRAYVDSTSAGHDYGYTVRACNVVGCSAQRASPTVMIPTAPGAPTSLTATVASASRIDLAWGDGSTNESRFEVYRHARNPDLTWGAYTLVTTRSANVVAFQDVTSLAMGTTYQYRVRACNVTGCSGYVYSAAVTIPTLPAAPTGLTASAASASQVTLAWHDAATNETSFSVWVRSLSGGTWSAYTLAGTAPANAAGFASTGLLAASTYSFRVRACNTSGCSAWAYTAEVSTLH
ncbi:MAG TPA: fibronectin type III domain-containing protein, partial [Longimicrobiaceae bacterium]|nr:fibronectin type III domain-containing protein [Longimicrobiaceae bacterium]